MQAARDAPSAFLSHSKRRRHWGIEVFASTWGGGLSDNLRMRYLLAVILSLLVAGTFVRAQGVPVGVASTTPAMALMTVPASPDNGDGSACGCGDGATYGRAAPAGGDSEVLTRGLVPGSRIS